MADGSIARTLRVLRTVCEDGPQTLKALSERTGLTPPTLLRTLRLMSDEGFVAQQPDRTWRATMLVWRLGYAVNSTVGVSTIAREFTDRITRDLDETSVYSVYEHGQVTYAARSEPPKPVRAHVRLGRSYDLLTTVTGQAVLAFLPPDHAATAIEQQWPSDDHSFTSRREVAERLTVIRADGYASGVGVRWPEVWATAVPVFGPEGEPVGALGVSIPVERVPADPIATIDTVRRAAADMTTRLGGRVHAPSGSPGR